jgi:hypothetical protein
MVRQHIHQHLHQYSLFSICHTQFDHMTNRFLASNKIIITIGIKNGRKVSSIIRKKALSTSIT